MAKEWKGNSNSAHAAIAAHRGEGKSMRQSDDFYATDPKALDALLDHCSLFLQGVLSSCRRDNYRRLYATYYNGEKHITAPAIWECACGNGNLYRVLDERGYKCIYSDIKDRSTADYPLKYKGMLNKNFLKVYDFPKPWIYNVAVILTNPPYSLANDFIKHALDILPDNGLYIALMNITYLAGQKRYNEIYQFGTLREIYVFSKRVECWKNGEKPTDGCGSIANYAWFVFQKGYCGQPTLYWL